MRDIIQRGCGHQICLTEKSHVVASRKHNKLRPCDLNALVDAEWFLCLHHLVSVIQQRRRAESVTPLCKDVAVVGHMYKDHAMPFVAQTAIPSIVFFCITKR